MGKEFSIFSMDDFPEDFRVWARRMKHMAPGLYGARKPNQKTDRYRFAIAWNWKSWLLFLGVVWLTLASIFAWGSMKPQTVGFAFWDFSKGLLMSLAGGSLLGAWAFILISLFLRVQSPFGRYIYLTPEFLFEISANQVKVYSWEHARNIEADINQSNSVVRFWIGRRRFRLLVAGWHQASVLAKQIKAWVASQQHSSIDISGKESSALEEESEEKPENPPPFSIDFFDISRKKKYSFGKILNWSYPFLVTLIATRLIFVVMIPAHNQTVFHSMTLECKRAPNDCLGLLKNSEAREQFDDFWFETITASHPDYLLGVAVDRSASSDSFALEKERMEALLLDQKVFPQGKHINEVTGWEAKIDDHLFALAKQNHPSENSLDKQPVDKVDDKIAQYQTLFQGKGRHEQEIKQMLLVRLPKIAKNFQFECLSKESEMDTDINKNPCEPAFFKDLLSALFETKTLQLNVTTTIDLPDLQNEKITKEEKQNLLIGKDVELAFPQAAEIELKKRTVEAFSNLIPGVPLAIAEQEPTDVIPKTNQSKSAIEMQVKYEIFFMKDGRLDTAFTRNRYDLESSIIYRPVFVGSLKMLLPGKSIKEIPFTCISHSGYFYSKNAPSSFILPGDFSYITSCLRQLFGVGPLPVP